MTKRLEHVLLHLKDINGFQQIIRVSKHYINYILTIFKFFSDNGITSYLEASYRNKNVTYDILVHKSDDVLKIYNNLYQNAHFFLKRKELKFGSLLKKFNRQHLVNSREEMSNSNLEPSLNNEEGVETLH